MEDWARDAGLTPELVDLFVTCAMRVVGVIVALFVAFVVAGWAKRALVGRLTKVGFDATLTKFVGSLS